MADILPDGSLGGYEGYCHRCGETIKTNIQGNEIGTHACLSGLESIQYYIDKLRKNSFAGWSEDAKTGYLTALLSIEKKIAELK